MKKIDHYVDSVYENVKGNRAEIQDLKAEMRSHLLETVHDLKLEGLPEDQAVEMAIHRFGKEHELQLVISELFQTQKSFGRKLLYTGMAFLVMFSLLFIVVANTGNERASEQAVVAYKMADIVSHYHTPTTESKEEIQELFHRYEYIVAVKAYSEAREEASILSTATYELTKPVPFPKSLFIDTYSYGTDDSFIILDVIDYRTAGIILLIIGLTSFSLLFIIWLLIFLYHRKIARTT